MKTKLDALIHEKNTMHYQNLQIYYFKRHLS